MTSYYPSQASHHGHGHHHSYGGGQPAVYSTSGYGGTAYGGYQPAGGVMYVPSSHRSHRSRSRSGYGYGLGAAGLGGEYGGEYGGVDNEYGFPNASGYDYDDYPHRHSSRRRSSRSHGRRHRHHSSSGYGYRGAYPELYPAYYSVPQQVMSTGAPAVIVQPSHNGGYHHGHHRYTFGQRMRRFFGLAPTPNFKYKSDRNSWGFMGYSKRQRYVDPRTGGEVDRDGRPVLRV